MEHKPNYFIQSYADRTLRNYEEIINIHNEDQTQEQCRVFEVTQLINSFFGVLIVPFEASKPYKDKTDSTNTIKAYDSVLQRMKKADSDAVESILNLIGHLKEDHRIYDNYPFDVNNPKLIPVLFIERIRNALSHGGDTGLRFFPATVPVEEDNQISCITSVIFVDRCNEGTFIVELNVEEMEDLLRLLHRIYSKHPVIKKLEANKYEQNIRELRSIMDSQE